MATREELIATGAWRGNFPWFMFDDRPDVRAAAKAAELTNSETDLFGYDYARRRTDLFGGAEVPPDWMVVKEYGGTFRYMAKVLEIRRRLGALDAVAFGWCLKRPGSRFSFCGMPKEDVEKAVVLLPLEDGEAPDLTGLGRACEIFEEGLDVGTPEKRYGPREIGDEAYDLVTANRDPLKGEWVGYRTRFRGPAAKCFKTTERKEDGLTVSRTSLTDVGKCYLAWWRGEDE